MAKFGKVLVWLRRDLRLEDHRALHEAGELGDQWAAAFVFDRAILDDLPADDRRLTFIHGCLAEVDEGLRRAGSALLCRHGEPVEEIAQLAQKLGADAVFASHDDDPYALHRDARAQARLADIGVAFQTLKDHVIFERQEVMGQTGLPFRVYSPYMRAWKALFQDDMADELPVDLSRAIPSEHLPEDSRGLMPLEQVGFKPQPLVIAPGASEAKRRLEGFSKAGLEAYARQRDRLDIEGVSGMSPHLRHGSISVRACFRAALSQDSKGAEKWLNELIWREFYHMILACFPHVVEGSFRPEYKDLEWPGNPEHLEAWKEGQTGYPIIDAAMRCFNATGWMHNRLRMITASFLTKDLLIDWRAGEDYFARGLLDFELSSNNGGWQWAASTGVDSQPYFRVFNPWLQSVKFDPDAVFIREWLPEIAHLPTKTLHDMNGSGLEGAMAEYPAPIVDHKAQRARAIALLSLKGEG